MANWELVLRVKGQHLDKAMSLVHTLRPMSLEVHPIAETSPARNGTQRARIIAVVSSERRGWKVEEVAEKLGLPHKTVGIALAGCVTDKLLKRVSTGIYKAVK